MRVPTTFHFLPGRSLSYRLVVAGLLALVALGGASSLYLEHHGHWVTGMSNQVVWGLPHVFAVFLLLAASGALNVASVGSVFGREVYQPMGRLSVLLAAALLIGGVAVLGLDLGRPDRLLVAATNYNFTSIFCLNFAIYGGFVAFAGGYLWAMMDPAAKRFYTPIAVGAFLWRLVLTTGTGSIFGFLVARSAFHSALMAPMFIALSFSFGLAVFNLVLLALHFGNGRPALPPLLLGRLCRLTAILAAASLYMVVIFHLTNLYIAERRDLERFLLAEGGLHTGLLWVGFVGLGSLAPIALLLGPVGADRRKVLGLASLLVAAGGICLVYVIIIGGQVFPVEVFPDEIVESGFFDGRIASYAPGLPETLLGLSAFAIAGLVLIAGLRLLDLLPEN